VKDKYFKYRRNENIFDHDSLVCHLNKDIAHVTCDCNKCSITGNDKLLIRNLVPSRKNIYKCHIAVVH